MKIFRVKVDPSEFQTIISVDNSDETIGKLFFDGEWVENWQPLAFFIFNTKRKRGNFFFLGSLGAFACDEAVVNTLGYFFSNDIQLLPINLEDGTKLFIINVTACINSMDLENSTYVQPEDGRIRSITKYAFHRRFTDSSIFKIPQTSKWETLCYSGVKSPNDEFYSAYTASGLTGLSFELLFED